MKTTVLKKSQIIRHWHLIDLQDKILGRIATEIASLLIGKNKPLSSPNLDSGDYVVATNAASIRFTGKKLDKKLYQSHSGYPGGFKELTLKQMMAKNPIKVIELAVRGMLPKNKFRDLRMRRLKVYLDDKHPHQSQLESSNIKK